MNMKTEFDVIVVGVGSMGSSTCYHLASKGLSVLAIEQFDSPHDQGSHAGQSRIIRKAYFEHPHYVPLLEKAYSNWRDIERKAGKQIYFPTGLLYAGKPDQVLIKGVRESAQKYNINVESLSASEAKARFSRFFIPSNYEILFEPDAGFITPERAIQTYKELAKISGAEIHSNERVISWEKNRDTIKVLTNNSSYTCKKIIFTAGAWTEKLIPALKKSLNVTRQVIAWVNPKENSAFELGKFPCWMIDDEHVPGMYYGFPSLDVKKFGAPAGLKLAYHYPGLPSDADNVNRVPEVEEESRLVSTMEKYLPNTYSSTHTLKTCLYANTPDENFILDFLPGYDKQVIIGGGFSGHGFKFVSAVGEILCDLATDGGTRLPIGFLNAARFIS